MVLTVHIWWEFNVVNSKFSGIWVLLSNKVGNPTCIDYEVIYGGQSQPVIVNDVTSCHETI